MILRVDDRLVHGQVIAGWVRPLGISRLVLVSDEIASDDWARNTYALAVPEEIKFLTCTIDGFGECMKEKVDRTMVIVGSLKDAFSLVERGLKIGEINLGCLNYDEGKKEICSYIYLSTEDIKYACRLAAMGLRILARALPTSPPVDVARILKGGKN